MKDRIKKALEGFVKDYAHVKGLILKAEELDVQFRSNIITIKEMRDAGDHVMRFLADSVSEGDIYKGEEYQLQQIEKARGHVFRAGYDALDGIVVSYRIRLADAMTKISNEAIAEIFPAYYEKFPQFEEVCLQVAVHRQDKDIGSHTSDNLEKYMERAKDVAAFCSDGLKRIPLMRDWDRKARRKLIYEKVVLVIIASVVAGLTVATASHYLLPKKSEPQNKTTNSAVSNSVSFPANLPLSAPNNKKP